jgi:hypothetical protein
MPATTSHARKPSNGVAHWLIAEIAEGVAADDARRVAHRLGGIVANDDRVAAAIQAALDQSSDLPPPAASEVVLQAVVAVLTSN